MVGILQRLRELAQEAFASSPPHHDDRNSRTKERIIATPHDNDDKPTIHAMLQPTSAPWPVPLAPGAHARLARGFSPRDMDDRWAVVSVAVPVAEQTQKKPETLLQVSFVRSWTGHCIARLTVAHDAVVEIAWEQDAERAADRMDEGAAKELVQGLTRGLVGVELGHSSSSSKRDRSRHRDRSRRQDRSRRRDRR